MPNCPAMTWRWTCPACLPSRWAISRVTLAADYLTGPRQFDVTKLAVTAPGFALDASGTVTLNDNGAPGLVAKARIPGACRCAPCCTTGRCRWRRARAAGSTSNIFAGTIGPLEAQTNFPPGMLDQDILPEDSLKLTFAMKDVEGNYIRGLTHATDVQGDAIMTGDTFKANFTSGRIGPLTAQQRHAR